MTSRVHFYVASGRAWAREMEQSFYKLSRMVIRVKIREPRHHGSYRFLIGSVFIISPTSLSRKFRDLAIPQAKCFETSTWLKLTIEVEHLRSSLLHFLTFSIVQLDYIYFIKLFFKVSASWRNNLVWQATYKQAAYRQLSLHDCSAVLCKFLTTESSIPRRKEIVASNG
jgi:hypothetical protein